MSKTAHHVMLVYYMKVDSWVFCIVNAAIRFAMAFSSLICLKSNQVLPIAFLFSFDHLVLYFNDIDMNFCTLQAIRCLHSPVTNCRIKDKTLVALIE